MARTKGKQAALPIALSAAFLATACSGSAAQPAHSPQASRELAKALAGYSAQPPVSCIPNLATRRMQVIDDRTILFHTNRTIYLQTPPGGCFGIGNQLNTLVTKVWGADQLCEGDINRLVDFSTGIGGGTCVFGPFVPYTKAS